MNEIKFMGGCKRPFWDRKKKMYDLKDCPCGGTQDANDIGVLYTGYGNYGMWNVYCSKCGRYVRKEKEMDAVNAWNERVNTNRECSP